MTLVREVCPGRTAVAHSGNEGERMSQPWRGVFSIAYTPFDEKGSLLWDDFERLCDWIARSGAHGLVWPVMASEYTVISFPERV